MLHNLTLNMPYEHVLKTWQERFKALGPVEGEEFSARKALAEDGLILQIRPEQRDTFNNLSYDEIVRMHAHLNILTPMNYSIFHGTKLLLIVNIMVEATNVAEISFLTDENLPNASKAVRLHMLRQFKEALNDLPFRRVQARVKASFDIGTKFVERLGFENEGTLRQFGVNGEDYYMYGLIK